MKLTRKITLSLISLIVAVPLYAQQAMKEPMLVLDMKNTPTYPKNFRTTSNDLPVAPGMNKTGLSDLHAVGSAQFSVQALKKVVEKVHPKHMLIIDLRQESHGFLNGNAISWFAPRNAINANKSDQQIEQQQTQLLQALAKEKSATVYSILKRDKADEITQTKAIEYRVHSVSSEAEVAQSQHLSYERIYVQDHHAPSEKQVNHFINRVKDLPADTWVYFHCRGGAGRTTTFMMMYDMMHNAKQLSFDEITQRQIAIGGKDVTTLPDESSTRYKSATARLAFLKKFYEYAKSNDDNFATSFKLSS